jgi:ABC-type antimicrobial peptide transport system permease subunit
VDPDANVYAVALLSLGSGFLFGAVPAGVVLAMLLLGLLATLIPAQRALSIDPLIMLRKK